MKIILALGVTMLALGCSNGNNPSDGGSEGGIDAGADTSPTDGSVKDVAVDAPNEASTCPITAGSGTVTGTLLGNTLAAKDAISSSANGTSFIAITDYTSTCADGLNNLKANSSALLFDFPATPTLSVGTVNVGAAVDVAYATYNATCNSPTGESSTGGSVTITAVTACSVQGTFDVTLNTDHVTGSFTAPVCTNMNAVDGGQGCL